MEKIGSSNMSVHFGVSHFPSARWLFPMEHEGSKSPPFAPPMLWGGPTLLVAQVVMPRALPSLWESRKRKFYPFAQSSLDIAGPKVTLHSAHSPGGTSRTSSWRRGKHSCSTCWGQQGQEPHKVSPNILSLFDKRNPWPR